MTSLAIITGASRGIGQATAERFITAGWAVANLSRTPCPVPGVMHYPCDVADTAQLTTVLDGLDLRPYSRVTIIHNAALLHKDTALTLQEDDFLTVLKVNVVAPQLINQRLIPQLPPGSSIIFIGSTVSEIGLPGMLSYVASKHALAGVMRATAQDLEGSPLHSCMVAPGSTDTQMMRDAVGLDNLENVTKGVLLNRLIAPGEIAELVLMASQNPVLNGSIIRANCGQKVL